MRTSVLLTIVRYLRHDSSGDNDVALRSKARPAVGGAQRCSVRPNGLQPAAPCTISRQSRRAGLTGALDAKAVVGIIASRYGSATMVPSPLRNVRRGSGWRLMNAMRRLLT